MKERLMEVAQKFEEDPDNDGLWRETDELDQERKKCMLKVEREALQNKTCWKGTSF